MIVKRAGAWGPAVIVAVLASLSTLHAQGQNDDSVSRAFADTGGMFLTMAIVLFVVNLIPLVWVARDAKTRGVDGADFWIALVLFFSVLGLLGYLIGRPRGPLVKCPHCGNDKRQAMVACPHCHTG